MLEFLEAYEDVGHGNWPMGGGTLDQSRSFLQAVRWMRREEIIWREKRRIPDFKPS